MSEYFTSLPLEPLSQPPRHEELELQVDRATERDLAKKLADTAGELYLLAQPTVRERTVDDVQLIAPFGTALPPRYNLLNFTSAEFKNGKHKTKITLPGRSFINEGDNPDSLNLWRCYSGTTEGDLIDHAGLITYLRPMLPECPNINALPRNVTIDNNTMREALWGDISTQSSAWADVSRYEARKYVSTSLAIDGSINPDDRHLLGGGADYASMISSVLSVVKKQDSSSYKLRIGTELPIILRPAATSENLDVLQSLASESLIECDSKDTVELYQEYRLSLEQSRQNTHLAPALAVLAIESHDLSANALELLTLSTALDAQERRQLKKTYLHAMKLILDTHLGS